jgi:hypothetical protein
MAAKLLETANQLPPGQDYHNALLAIGRFRAQKAALEAPVRLGPVARISTERLKEQIGISFVP